MIDEYYQIPYTAVRERWENVNFGWIPPWDTPPNIGERLDPVERLLLLTVKGRIFEIDWPEYFRLIPEGQLMVLRFENGYEEKVMEIYGSPHPRLNTAKQPFAWLATRKINIVVEPKPETNVIPFKKRVKP